MTQGQRILRDWDHAIKHRRRTALNSPERSFWVWLCNAYAEAYASLMR